MGRHAYFSPAPATTAASFGLTCQVCDDGMTDCAVYQQLWNNRPYFASVCQNSALSCYLYVGVKPKMGQGKCIRTEDSPIS
ncbi:hypothetical protein BV898_13518 [Hypsibius exemplaris]|uniref:Uncharacterized protein n=1 Tax=Hypsibius exemplaris TaxID=2072580 RepID=A0A1W0WAD5_HYPEX|nr:hypothetical protein BV898_13518 [Hypsibius exemplaris]